MGDGVSTGSGRGRNEREDVLRARQREKTVKSIKVAEMSSIID